MTVVTGGHGFIGRYLCRELERQGVEYYTVSGSHPMGDDRNYKADILDRQALEEMFSKLQPNVVVHLAAIASPVHNDISEIYRINVAGSENLLAAAAKCLRPGTRMILISTAGVYGNQDASYLHESLPYAPVNHYSYSKMIMEMIATQYTDALDIRIVRPFNVIGSGQNQNFFIPKLVQHFVRREKVLRVGNLDAVRDYIPVELCAKFILKMAFQKRDKPKTVNVCTGIGHSCRQVIQMLEELTGHHPYVCSVDTFSRSNEIWRLVGDTTRMSGVMRLDFTSDILRDCLNKMLAECENRI